MKRRLSHDTTGLRIRGRVFAWAGLAVILVAAGAWIQFASGKDFQNVRAIGYALCTLMLGGAFAAVGRSDLREAAALEREDQLRRARIR